MSLLSWLVRFVFVMLVVRLIVSALSGGTRPAQTRRTGAAGPPASNERAGGTLVRDPHCGTYVMQSRAIRSGSGGDVQYFCSDACRDAYRAAHSSVA